MNKYFERRQQFEAVQFKGAAGAEEVMELANCDSMKMSIDIKGAFLKLLDRGEEKRDLARGDWMVRAERDGAYVYEVVKKAAFKARFEPVEVEA